MCTRVEADSVAGVDGLFSTGSPPAPRPSSFDKLVTADVSFRSDRYTVLCTYHFKMVYFGIITSCLRACEGN